MLKFVKIGQNGKIIDNVHTLEFSFEFHTLVCRVHLRLIQSGFSHVSVVYSEPIEIEWRKDLSFYLSHYPIRVMNPSIGAISKWKYLLLMKLKCPRESILINCLFSSQKNNIYCIVKHIFRIVTQAEFQV